LILLQVVQRTVVPTPPMMPSIVRLKLQTVMSLHATRSEKDINTKQFVRGVVQDIGQTNRTLQLNYTRAVPTRVNPL